MSKLLEKNGTEMASALVSMAIPLKNFIEDKEFMDEFYKCTRRGVRSKLEGILTIYSGLVPLLFGDKHLKDTLTIISVVEGTNVQNLLKMNGAEMIEDCMKAWSEQIKPFFSRLGLTA